MLGAATVAFSGSSSAAVSAVTGSAYGYQLQVSLFGGPPSTRGFGQVACTAPNVPVGCASTPTTSDTPSVELASGGSVTPLTDTEPSVSATVGPAAFLVTGPQTVTTTGTTGPTGSVTATATIESITTDGGGALAATTLSASCTTSAAGVVSGTTTVAGGVLETDSGDDVNGDDDFTDPGEHAPVTVPVPDAPAVNASFTGHIHVNSVQEDFVYTFNEQVTEASGALTVYAAHQGIGEGDTTDPIAVGDLFIGKVTCGLTGLPDGAVTTTTLPGQTTTSSSTSSTTPGSSTTSSTTPGSSTTSSSTPGSSTSSTVAATSTTRATGAGTGGTGSGGNLPRTGTGAFVLALLGLALLAAGAVTKVLGKKVS